VCHMEVLGAQWEDQQEDQWEVLGVLWDPGVQQQGLWGALVVQCLQWQDLGQADQIRTALTIVSLVLHLVEPFLLVRLHTPWTQHDTPAQLQGDLVGQVLLVMGVEGVVEDLVDLVLHLVGLVDLPQHLVDLVDLAQDILVLAAQVQHIQGSVDPAHLIQGLEGQVQPTLVYLTPAWQDPAPPIKE